ncbi:MAG: hypothetical protein LC641_13635 [Spirochaeta sp.]|nr:hypothetical protein [Spirochaeta sp.]
MILLDTNYLIRMLVQGSVPAAQVSEWLELRTPRACAMPVGATEDNELTQ